MNGFHPPHRGIADYSNDLYSRKIQPKMIDNEMNKIETLPDDSERDHVGDIHNIKVYQSNF